MTEKCKYYTPMVMYAIRYDRRV